jgi:hypothetical protein
MRVMIALVMKHHGDGAISLTDAPLFFLELRFIIQPDKG